MSRLLPPLRRGRWLALALLLVGAPAAAQDFRIGDLTVADQDVPIRLVGYGLVIGLDGTGDRALGGPNASQTVRSVANLLRNFQIEVPAEVLRTRNVAAVLVTAEASPYLRAGVRVDVQVSSMGDAASLRGGVLWATPLVTEVGAAPVATAQGSLVLSEGVVSRTAYTVETSARVPGGGLIEGDLPRGDFAAASRLLLREPSIATASRMAAAINGALGAGTATVLDPGALELKLQTGADADRAAQLSRIADLRVQPDRLARVLIDGRDGTVVAGGNVVVGEAVVSHGGLTLAIAAQQPAASGEPAPGELQVRAGTTVQDVALALHRVSAPPAAIAAIFDALRRVGALPAEVTVR